MLTPSEDAILKMLVDDDKITIDVALQEPLNLPWGVQLRGYALVVGREGILMGRLELSEPVQSLSVSPESLEAPPDEGWQG